ncbi:MAG: SpoIIE family protein phosphatase [Akkermansiaceae bacterium]|nr:SpoIIE family protein phosphatase [Armatimonadota bacterium]
MEQEPIDFRQLGEHSSERIAVLDAGFRYAYVNPAFERLVGMQREEILGHSPAELFPHLADSERVAHHERAMRERVVVEFDTYCPRQDRWDHVRCVPEPGGGLIVFSRDDPGRERAEHRLQRLFDSRVVGVIYWDLDTGRITDANDAFLSMVCYTRDDLAAGRLDFRAMTPPEWTERNEQGVAAIREHGAAPTYEKEYFRKDGSRVPILIGGTRFEESGSEGFSYILDITERKQLEREQERLLAEARALAEREALINQIGDGIRQSLAPEEIERVAVAALGNALAADRCYLMAIDLPANSVAIARDWCADGVPSMAGQHRISDMGVDLAELFASGETLIVTDARPESEGRLSDRNAANNERVGVSSFLNVPFYDGDRLVGALGVAMTRGQRDWAPEEVTLAETVAGQLRPVLEAARLQRRERNIARQLQQALQPPAPFLIPGFRLASHYSAALGEAEVGGDFHDTFPLDDTRSVLVVADLSGKGLDAASQVASVRNQLRYALYTADLGTDGALATVVERLNSVLARHELLTGFATVFVAIWDDAVGTLTYVNAGQEPALIWRAFSNAVEMLPPTGPVLGGFVGGKFAQRTVALAAGDVWIAFSDGMTEIGPSRKELLGIEGVVPLFGESCLAAGGVDAPEPILGRLISAVEAFARGTGMRDDLCALVGVRGGM